MAEDKTKLAVAAQFETLGEAYIAQGMLRANGIECQLNNQIISSVFALPAADFDQIRLIVREDDLEEARRLLAENDDD